VIIAFAWDPRGQRIVTAIIVIAIIDQVLRDVYAALVLGCKMEIPDYVFGHRSLLLGLLPGCDVRTR